MTNTLLSMMEGNGTAAYIVLLALGILLVVKGGDWFVDAASWIAEVSGIPSFIVGATIVSVATTLPEILVSSISAAQGQAEMAIGNALGSVNCNIALIMAISLAFTYPTIKRKDYIAKISILIATIAVLWGLSASGDFSWWNAIILLALFVSFIIENLISAKNTPTTSLTTKTSQRSRRIRQKATEFCLTISKNSNREKSLSRKPE